MSQSISIGLDFGSLQYRAAYVFEGAIVPVPVPAGDRTWIGSVIFQPTQTGITFSSLKYQLGTGQALAFRGVREAAEDVIRDTFLNIKQSVEDYAGESVEQVVISVPARYSAFRRSEVIKIAEAVGFGKATLINDCTAAAIGYTFDTGEEALTLLVYSMGFIGFEVSLLRMARGRLREIAHEGSDSPSGRDFDLLVMRACVELFRSRGTPLPTKTYTDHWFDLRIIAAGVKEQLSVNDETLLSLPTYITGTEPKDIRFRRTDFEQVIAPEIGTTMDLVDRILEDANLSHADIDKVLLVGGSTRIGYIQRQLEERFGPKLIQPRDDVLARGAAIQASILADRDQEPDYSLPAIVVEGDREKETPTLIDEQRLSASAEASSDEIEVSRPEVEPLFDYAQKLMDSGDYEEADEFLKVILRKVESTRGELKRRRRGQ